MFEPRLQYTQVHCSRCKRTSKTEKVREEDIQE
jgi:hypothetical protein